MTKHDVGFSFEIESPTTLSSISFYLKDGKETPIRYLETHYNPGQTLNALITDGLDFDDEKAIYEMLDAEHIKYMSGLTCPPEVERYFNFRICAEDKKEVTLICHDYCQKNLTQSVSVELNKVQNKIEQNKYLELYLSKYSVTNGIALIRCASGNLYSAIFDDPDY